MRQLRLRIVKSEAEQLLLGSWRATQHIHGLAKKELCRAVKRELEEQRLEVNGRVVFRNLRDEMLDVRLEGIEIRNLTFGEAGTDERLCAFSFLSFPYRQRQ